MVCWSAYVWVTDRWNTELIKYLLSLLPESISWGPDEKNIGQVAFLKDETPWNRRTHMAKRGSSWVKLKQNITWAVKQAEYNWEGGIPGLKK